MSDNADSPPAAAPAGPSRPECLCMGLGPELTRLLRHLAPSEDAWQRLRTAELEVLKVLSALVEDRIRALSHEPERGTKVDVE
jgi:hypothetical protein